MSPFPDAENDVAPGSLLAPMPGAVIRIAVEVGDVVDQGQALLWLEAMKMQHEIVAPCEGIVTEIRSGVGEQVEVGAVLAVVTAEDPDAPSEIDRTLGVEQGATMNFTESDEQAALRAAVAKLADGYGADYAAPRARRNEPLDELWSEAGSLGYLGVNLPVEFGGGGRGMYELSLVEEEFSARRLRAADDGRVTGDLWHRHRPLRHRRAAVPLVARPRGRLGDHGIRHHRSRRRLQFAPHHHHCTP